MYKKCYHFKKKSRVKNLSDMYIKYESTFYDKKTLILNVKYFIVEIGYGVQTGMVTKWFM